MTEREEFEEAVKNSGIFIDDVDYNQVLMRNTDGRYSFTVISNFYYFWQAAKAQAVPKFKPFSERPEYEKPLLISVNGEVRHSAYMLCVTDGVDEWLEEINGIGPDIIDIETVDGWMYWPKKA